MSSQFPLAIDYRNLTSFGLKICLGNSQAWWHRPVIPEVRGQRQEGQEFRAILSYIASFRPAWGQHTPQKKRGRRERRQRRGGKKYKVQSCTPIITIKKKYSSNLETKKSLESATVTEVVFKEGNEGSGQTEAPLCRAGEGGQINFHGGARPSPLQSRQPTWRSFSGAPRTNMAKLQSSLLRTGEESGPILD